MLYTVVDYFHHKEKLTREFFLAVIKFLQPRNEIHAKLFRKASTAKLNPREIENFRRPRN